MPSPSDAERLDAIELIEAIETMQALIAKFGAVRVAAWVRNLAALTGTEV